MMTQIAPERSIALVEYISHLSVRDWTSVAYDLTNLGFVPPGAAPAQLLLLGPEVMEQHGLYLYQDK